MTTYAQPEGFSAVQQHDPDGYAESAPSTPTISRDPSTSTTRDFGLSPTFIANPMTLHERAQGIDQPRTRSDPAPTSTQN
ncbi:hypothetical protein CC2G_004905 [Coprinopsis cinerea AmutBmut pab1-1]|nr:hypothetical protein CC2G_004905 [Coprinopsis cinerea AmutBmut pab1-1]